MTDDEAGFIEAIGRDQAPELARQIYADWLEERGDIRAEFLRLNMELSRLWKEARKARQPANLRYVEPIARAQIRLRELRKEISDEWLTKVYLGPAPFP